MESDVEMSKKLTEKSLEKKLHNMGTEELIQIIMSLYRSNKSVEQSINLQIIGDAYHDAIVAAGHRMKNYINYGRTGWKVFYMILQASAGGWRSILWKTSTTFVTRNNSISSLGSSTLARSNMERSANRGAHLVQA